MTSRTCVAAAAPGPPLLALFIPLALVLGIWLGGHPDWLPGFARETLVADSDGRLYEEAIDTIERDYYRKVDRDALLNTSLSAAVESLQDQFSHYFDPKEYTNFQLDTEGRFEGVGMSVRAVKQGLRVEEVYDGSPAKEGGLKAGDIIVAANGKLARGQDVGRVDRADQGPGGHERAPEAERRARADAQAREGRHPDRAVRARALGRQEDRLGAARRLHVGLGRRRQGRGREGAQGGRQGRRARPAPQRRRPPERGGDRLVGVPGRRARGVHEGPRARRSASTTPRAGRSRTRSRSSCWSTRASASASEIVTGALQDRKRAKVVGTRTFGKGVFQEIERLPNGGALDITVGEYFTPSGRNLGGGGVRKGAGMTPDIQATDDPKTSRDEALQKALETVAAG